jgi:sn-glycerol 3-phosphate transport system substrate-binding protein
MPGPSETPAVQVGGASLWVVDGKSDEVTAAVWDFVAYLTTAQTQSTWTAATGYVPIRTDALELDPIAATYANDPRFSVPYEQLLAPVSDLSSNAPVLGPQREVRVITARAVAAIIEGADVQATLTDAVAQANAQIQTYNSLN